MGRSVLLDLVGGVTLLLWGLHMVQSGFVRAFGSDLRHALNKALSNRFTAFLAGLGVTAVLQSSTATALMATSFAAKGIVDLTPALAVMLGANVGTTLIVQALTFDVSAAAPILLLAGLFAFRRGSQTRTRDLGRVAIGLGLILLSLHSLLGTFAPAEQAPALRALLAASTQEPLVNVLIGAALTWAAHSSVAVVLLVTSLAFSHFVTPVAALALVLGANFGSAINPVFEGASGGQPATLRLPVGNLLNRALGCAAVLPFLHPLAGAFAQLETSPVRQVADFHTAFNLALAALFILPLDGYARLLTRFFPERTKVDDPDSPMYLDETAIAAPAVALACAARETLHMGDVVETMLRKSATAVMADDRKMVTEISRMDNVVDRLHEAIKLYVVQVSRESLEERDARRAMEIISFAINLEHVGDIIDKNLMELAAKKIKYRLQFSKEGAAELEVFHRQVVENLKLAFSVFISGDVKLARNLLEEKARLREAELAAAEKHFARLRDGKPESIETSSLHLDILRDLKRIHSHICAAAYPVLEVAGALQPSRLREGES